jgi:hypothetical protein
METIEIGKNYHFAPGGKMLSTAVRAVALMNSKSSVWICRRNDDGSLIYAFEDELQPQLQKPTRAIGRLYPDEGELSA